MHTRAAAVLLLAAAACAGDDASPDRRPATTGTTVEAEVSTTTTIAVTPDEGIGAVEATLADLLVTADELGDPALTDLGYTPDDTAPCRADAVTLDEPGALVGTRIGADGREVLQELRAYDDADAAADAVDSLRSAPACAGARDVTAEVGGDQAFATDLEAAGDDVVLVAQVVDVVAYFRIEGFTAPLDIAAFGTGKVLAFLEHGG